MMFLRKGGMSDMAITRQVRAFHHLCHFFFAHLRSATLTIFLFLFYDLPKYYALKLSTLRLR